MDADQYVDIAIIASFNQVRKLTSDINLVVDVLRGLSLTSAPLSSPCSRGVLSSLPSLPPLSFIAVV